MHNSRFGCFFHFYHFYPLFPPPYVYRGTARYGVVRLWDLRKGHGGGSIGPQNWCRTLPVSSVYTGEKHTSPVFDLRLSGQGLRQCYVALEYGVHALTV